MEAMAKCTSFVFMFLLMTAHPLLVRAFLPEIVGAVAGGIIVTVGAPFALAGLGFGAAGITAGTLAAKAMSVAYTTGVGAGAVAALQSAGAVGFGIAGTVVGATVGAGTGHIVGKGLNPDDDDKCKQNF